MEKEQLRQIFLQKQSHQSPKLEAGLIAEKLRTAAAYKKARTIFVTPALHLKQIRLNALADGKILLMPSAGLKEGFYQLNATTIPLQKREYAVTPRGLPLFGKCIKSKDLSIISVDLIIGESIVVDMNGGRLGDGKGFLDLSLAILSCYTSLPPQPFVLTVITEEQIVDTPLPQDSWDIPVSGILTEKGLQRTDCPLDKEWRIYWQALPQKKIRKMQPLWDLYLKERPFELASWKKQEKNGA